MVEEGVRGVTEEGEGQRFKPVDFSMIGAFFVFSAASLVAPEYIGLEAPWRWIVYAVGGVFWLLGCLGFIVAVGRAYGGSEGFLLSVYVLSLFTLTTGLHLATVYVPVAGWLFAASRVFVYVLVLPLSLLTLLGAFRVLEGLSTPKSRTDAVLAALAILGALLPVLVSLLGGR